MGKLVTFICIFVSLNLRSTSCERNDVTFIIDASDSPIDQYDSTIDFVYNVTDMLPFGLVNNMFAAVTFNDSAYIQFNWNVTENKTYVLNAISNLKYVSPFGNRHTHTAISHVSEFVYSNEKFNQRTVVLIVRGGGTSPGDSLFASFSLQSIIDKLYVVGVGSFVNTALRDELFDIASDRDSVFLIQTFSGLCGLVSTLAIAIDSNATTANYSCSTEDDTTVSESVTTTAFYTTEETTQTSLVPETSNFTSTTENESSNLIIIVTVIVILVLILTVMVLGLVWYLKIYRKQKKLKELIEILANEYPDAKSGLGPTKSRYTEARPQVFKNGHSNKFHSYLKLTMMTNGHKPVFR